MSQDAKIPVVDVDGRKYVVVSRVCDELGISPVRQQQRLQNLPWANTERRLLPMAAGKLRWVVVVPLGLVPRWLEGINPNRIAEPARGKLSRLKVVVETYLSGKAVGTTLALPAPIEPEVVEPEVVEPESEPAVGSDLATFRFGADPVRVQAIGGDPWFVAKDVCAILGLTNVSLAVNGNDKTGDLGLDEDEKGIRIANTPGGPQEMLHVNESGLYSLTFKSRKPDAKRFRRWVTREVLPSIRRTGSYSLSPSPAPSNDPIEAALLASLETHRDIRRLTDDHSRLAARFDDLEADVAEVKRAALEAPPRRLTHMTVQGFAKHRGLKLTVEQLQAFGRRAAKLGRERGLEPRRIEDERWGSVLTHHLEILEGLLPEYASLVAA